VLVNRLRPLPPLTASDELGTTAQRRQALPVSPEIRLNFNEVEHQLLPIGRRGCCRPASP